MSTCSSSSFPGLFVSSLIDSTVVSVDHIGVVPWALLVWVVWLILHSIYRKCFEGLLKRIGVKGPQRQRMMKIYWKLAFAVINIPFSLQNLPLKDGDISIHLVNTLSELPKSLLISEPPSFHTKLVYVLLSGYFLNSVCETCIEFGPKSLEFFLNESLTIFFISTFPLRSVYFGVAVIAVVSLEKCFFELSRLLCCISSIGQSRILCRASSIILLFHTFVWCMVYWYILPKYFLILPINKLMEGGDASHVSLLLLVVISIWAYYIIEMFTSPLSKLLLDHFNGNHRALEKILFGSYEQVVEDFDIENHMNHSIERSMSHSQPHFKKTSKKISNPTKNRENLLLMYHTVKCVIRIRRKLKRIREQKTKETFYNANHTKEETDKC